MNLTDILDILKYVLPALIVLIGFFFITKNFHEADKERRGYELRKERIAENSKIVLPIRLQAYERLILFLERINPNNSIHRTRQLNMSATEMQRSLLQNIRSEFEHNMSQQLYVSKEAWIITTTAKEELIKLYNIIGSNFSQEASSLEYSKAVFDYLMNSNKEVPTQTAINFLKEDVKKFF